MRRAARSARRRTRTWRRDQSASIAAATLVGQLRRGAAGERDVPAGRGGLDEQLGAPPPRDPSTTSDVGPAHATGAPRRAVERRARRWGRAAAPGGSPRRGCPPRRARRRAPSSSTPCPCGRGAWRVSPPGRGSSEMLMPLGRLDLDAGQARAPTSSGRLERSFTCDVAGAPWALPCSAPSSRDQRRPAPSRAATPASRRTARRATAESGWWRTVTGDLPQRGAPLAAGRTSAATRSRHGVLRSQARSTT